MRINTPIDIQEVAWEGFLEAPPADLKTKGKLQYAGNSHATEARVTLGKPSLWPIEQVLEIGPGKSWTPPLGNQRYHLMRLACTLHSPTTQTSMFTEATLTAHLRPSRPSGAVMAYDLFPQHLNLDTVGKLSLELGPDLKIGPLKATVGKLKAEIDYCQAFPVITAFGLGESDPYWLFQYHRTKPLLGCQYVYAVLASSAGSNGVILNLEFRSVFKTRLWLLPIWLPEFAQAKLNFHLNFS